MTTRWRGARRGARQAAVAGAGALAAAALAGCGSLAAPGHAAPGTASGTAAGALGTGRAAGDSASGGAVSGNGASDPTASPSGPAQPGDACTAAILRIQLDTAAAGVAAGTEYIPLEFTNTSSQPCELTGYPAVALTSGVTGQQIGAEAAVDRTVPATAVLLAAGGVAHAWLGITDVADLPASKCRPVTAAGFRVVVPGSESASYLAHPVPACKESAQEGGILVVRPVQAGAAKRGTA
jgi:Protein of unknown function (DUF4232)